MGFPVRELKEEGRAKARVASGIVGSLRIGTKGDGNPTSPKGKPADGRREGIARTASTDHKCTSRTKRPNASTNAIQLRVSKVLFSFGDFTIRSVAVAF